MTMIHRFLAAVILAGLFAVIIGSAFAGNHLTPLQEAVKDGNIAEVKRLINGGADVNEKNHKGWTALEVVALYGRSEIVNVLIKHGAYINSKNDFGSTPLHVASYEGYTEIVHALIKAGADINVRNKYGKTPLDYAHEKGYSRVVAILENPPSVSLGEFAELESEGAESGETGGGNDDDGGTVAEAAGKNCSAIWQENRRLAEGIVNKRRKPFIGGCYCQTNSESECIECGCDEGQQAEVKEVLAQEKAMLAEAEECDAQLRKNRNHEITRTDGWDEERGYTYRNDGNYSLAVQLIYENDKPIDDIHSVHFRVNPGEVFWTGTRNRFDENGILLKACYNHSVAIAPGSGIRAADIRQECGIQKEARDALDNWAEWNPDKFNFNLENRRQLFSGNPCIGLP